MNISELRDLMRRMETMSGADVKNALKDNDSDLLRMYIYLTFDPRVYFGYEADEYPWNEYVAGGDAGLFGSNDVDFFFLQNELSSRTSRSSISAHLTTLNQDSIELILMLMRGEVSSVIPKKYALKLFPRLIADVKPPPIRKLSNKVDYPAYLEPSFTKKTMIAIKTDVYSPLKTDSIKLFSDRGVQIYSKSINRDLLWRVLSIFKHADTVDTNGNEISVLLFEVSGDSAYRLSMKSLKAEQVLDMQFNLVDVYTAAEFYSGSSRDICGTHKRKLMRDLIEWIDHSMFSLMPAYLVSNESEVYEYLEQCSNSGVTSVIVRSNNIAYRASNEKVTSLEIVDAYPAIQGKFKGLLGGLIVDHEGVKVNVTCGFTQYERETILKSWEVFKGTRTAPMISRNENSIKSMVKISYRKIDADGMLLNPIFVGFVD